MATSNSINFSVNRDDIIQEALELLGVIDAGDTPIANDITTCARTLNMMIKAWQIDGVQIFTVKRGYLFPIKNDHEYTLGTDHYTYSYTKQTIDGAAALGASTVDLTSASDFTDGDNIGIYQDDGTMHWTTGTKSSNTITLGAVTTAAVSDNATVYFYTTKAGRPMEVIEAFLRTDSLNDIPLNVISRKEYSELSNKTTDGSIVDIFYDPQVSTPNLFTWPETGDPRDIVCLWVKRTIEDFDLAADNPDFPQEWYYPIAYNLAVSVGPKFGTPATNQNFMEIKEQAIVWYEKAQNYSSKPEASITFEPCMEGYC